MSKPIGGANARTWAWRVRQLLVTAALIASGTVAHAASLTTIYEFPFVVEGPNTPVSGPGPGVAVGPGDSLFVATYYGGTGYTGAVVKLSPPVAPKKSWTAETVFSLPGGLGGAGPSTLVVDDKGAIYGTAQGGSGRCGVVFRVTEPPHKTLPWTETVLHTFVGGADGCRPSGGVTLAPDGSLYGSTLEGGNGKACGESGPNVVGCGTIFQLTPQTKPGPWKEKVLHAFQGPDGITPWDAPVLGLRNPLTLYGSASASAAASPASPSTTSSQGSGVNYKLILPLVPTGKNIYIKSKIPVLPILYIPLASPTPVIPSTTLVGPSEGGGIPVANCLSAGLEGCGYIYKLNPPKTSNGNSTLVVIHGFTGGADGSFPGSRLLVATTGLIYGTTSDGGKAGKGTIFRLTPDAKSASGYSYAVVHEFSGKDGAGPGGLVEYKGVIYGTTVGGGTGCGTKGCGTVFAFYP